MTPRFTASPSKIALITGITGQDGSYLAEFLLEKDYVVHGIKRRASSFNTTRIDHLYQDPHESDPRLVLHYGDLTDSTNLIRIIQQVQPDEIYNLGAQSHVAVSFEAPEYTANSDALGTLRILEAVRILGLQNKTRIYQASTSELYGLVQEMPQKESTPFYPRSPYGVAMLYGYWITVNYREAYGMYACNGILFNHESPRRGETFVTRKISRGLARIDAGLETCLYMGNLDSLRDWGHARDYVEMQWLMLQQDTPEDFVIATGRQESVRRFIELAADRDRLEEYRRIAAYNRLCGVDVHEIGPSQVQKLFPLCRVDDIHAGFYVPDDGRVNPVDATMALARGARIYGATVVEGVEVTEVLKKPGAGRARAAGVKTACGQTVEAEAVVNCCGMWARQLGALHGVSVPNQAAEHYYLITDAMPEVDPSWPVIEDPSSHAYIRPEGGGLMVGDCLEVMDPFQLWAVARVLCVVRAHLVRRERVSRALHPRRPAPGRPLRRTRPDRRPLRGTRRCLIVSFVNQIGRPIS